MFDNDSAQAWSVAKESYPDAVVFVVANGLFVVHGDDVLLLRQQFGVLTSSRWLAFDPLDARSYVERLLRLGRRVVLVRDGCVLELENMMRRPTSPRPHGMFLALDPLLLFEHRELSREMGPIWLLDDLRRALAGGQRGLAEFGQICVYAVGEWYEVDTELTTMLPHHVKLLAKIALDCGVKIPCLLVPPKPKRYSTATQKTIISPLSAQPLGQLSLGI